MTEPGANRLLARLFFRRFLENDLLSPSGDGHESVVLALALLVVAGTWVSLGLVLKSVNPWMSPFELLTSVLNDKFVGVAGSMIVTGLGTAIEWDALGLDRRDWAALGPLPISPRALVFAKLRALAWFVAAFALAMNGVPSLVYPPLQVDQLPVGLAGTLWLIVVHLVVSLAACAFGFLALLAVRETLRLAVGPRLFRRLSGVIHFVAVLVLVSALLLVVTSRVRVSEGLDRGDRMLALAPPTWFVGLYETMIGPVIQPLPAEAPTRKRQYWTLAENRQARSEYLGHAAAFRGLAGSAVGSLALLAVVCAGAFALNRRRIAPSDGAETSFHRSLGRRAWGVAARVFARHPVSRAGFFFTLQTLARSPAHRAYLAGFLAAGLAVVVVTLGVGGPWTALETAAAPPVARLAIQMMIGFFLVAGLRGVFALPSELRANWTFRLGWDGDARRYLEGVRRAARLGVLLPALILLAPFHAYAWGMKTAAWHFALGGFASWVLMDLALLRFNKLPFTCSYSPKGTLKTRWSWYLLTFIFWTYGFCTLEHLALGSTKGSEILAGSLCATLAGLLVYRRVRVDRTLAVIFDDPPELPTQRLGLTAGD